MKTTHDARAYLQQKIGDANDPRSALFNDMLTFMEAISSNDYETAELAVQQIARHNKGDLYQEVGKVTRKLHDSIRSFRDSIDPKFKELATSDMPNAVDKLQLVISRTEDAAHITMGIVEKYILTMETLDEHLAKCEGPADSVAYLKEFKAGLEDDLTTILTTQSFQDLTGQTIKKVIKLVGEIESELVKMITNFGVRAEPVAPAQPDEAEVAVADETVSQADVDDLLKNFGF